MRCPNCGSENPAEARFCSTCGTALSQEMPESEASLGEAAGERAGADEPPGPFPPEPPTPPEPPVPGPPPEPPMPEPPTPEPTPQPPTPQPTPPAPTVPIPPVPPVSAGGKGGEVLTSGWGTAVGRAVLAFVIVALLGQAIPWLATASDPAGAPDTPDVIKIGGVFFYLFHHAGIAFDLPNVSLGEAAPGPLGGQIPISATMALGLMLGTALAVWLLYRGGRAVAAPIGGRPAIRALNGAKVAIPYALLAFGLSFLVSFSFPLPPLPFFEGGQPLEIGPSPLAALLWPLGLGLLAGAWGGLSTAREEVRDRPRGRMLGAILGGGWRMAWYGLGLAFVGYLITAAVNPDVPLPFGPDYFRAVSGADSVLDAVNLLLITVLVIPNIATLVLVPAMGASLGFSGSAGGVQLSCTLLSYSRFPAGGAQPPEGGALFDVCSSLPIRFETAPIGYFLFLLVPLLAAILAGRRTARRAGAGSSAQGAAIGAASGVAFGAIVALLIILASITIKASGEIGGVGGSQGISIGPILVTGILFALAWGVAGGALGGVLGSGGETPTRAPSPGAETKEVPVAAATRNSGFEKTRPVTGFERPAPSGPRPPDSPGE
jgi:zinc-ribbon domain